MHPIPSGSQSILHYSVAILDDLRAFVEKTDERIYRAPSPAAGGMTTGASIGAHVRHCIEHFQSFFAGEPHGAIDYDQRRRDPEIESYPRVALDRLVEIQAHLKAHYANGRLNETVRLRGAVDAAGVCQFEIESTAARELHYVAFHALHHMAVIALLAAPHAIDVGCGFGKAPATLAFETSSG